MKQLHTTSIGGAGRAFSCNPLTTSRYAACPKTRERPDEELLRHYDKRRGIKWDFASLDSAMAKAPKR
jgi:hypothetical protein